MYPCMFDKPHCLEYGRRLYLGLISMKNRIRKEKIETETDRECARVCKSDTKKG